MENTVCHACCVCIQIYIYIYIYIHAQTHNAHAKADRKMSHAIVATCRETETCHMHNMAGQQAKTQERCFTSATGMWRTSSMIFALQSLTEGAAE